MTKTKKNKILAETKKIFTEMVELFPYATVYGFHTVKEKANEDGGHFGIEYLPPLKKIDLYVYRCLYEEIPDLTKKQIDWLKYSIAHEIGHLFIWELQMMVNRKYNHDLVEKIASDIAFLLVELHDRRYGRKQKGK